MPPDELPARVVTSRHRACGGKTRVRLPDPVPARALRRVVCDRCAEPYETDAVTEGDGAHEPATPGRPAAPAPAGEGRGQRLGERLRAAPVRRLAGLLVAAAAVVGILTLLQNDAPAPAPDPAATMPSATGENAGPNAPDDAQLVTQSTFQVALPADWEETDATGGATYAAAARDGEADMSLWVERDPSLDFAGFEARSLAQLESLVGSAEVVERNPAPTPEGTSVRIAPAAPPEGAPDYEVLLRASGDRWYYLATTVQPDAGPEARAALELIQGSFLPEGGSR